MVVHSFNLNTLGTEIGGFLEFKASQVYIAVPGQASNSGSLCKKGKINKT